MKKILLFVLMCAGIHSVQAQETESIAQNDLMIGPFELIIGPALNVSYERLINSDAGIGLNGLFVLEDGDGLRSQVSPFYRMYFGKKYASGFFIEGFVPITTTQDTRYKLSVSPQGYYSETYLTDKNTTVGVGLGIGGKWVARRNIVFEVSSGVARRFGKADVTKITAKGMLGIGYRF